MGKALLTVVAFTIAQVSMPAQQGGSSTHAAELVKRLNDSKMTVFAAPMPDDPSRFVAALHVPGIQLLVISASYQSPSLLREHLIKSDYRQVYSELNGAGDREGRFFVEDLGADGLRPDREPNAAFDITWRDGTERTLYNGEWKDQKLSQEEYRKRYARDEADYARALQTLLAAHQAQPTSIALGPAGSAP